MIIDHETGAVVWCFTALQWPLDAIYWDDDHIMVSAHDAGVFKIRLSDRAKVWQYDSEPHGHPFYLQKLSKHADSYGGDLLIGYWGPNPVVRGRSIPRAIKQCGCTVNAKNGDTEISTTD